VIWNVLVDAEEAVAGMGRMRRLSGVGFQEVELKMG